MASVQRTKKGTHWFFVFYDKETKKYTWEPSGVEIDTSTPTALKRSKDKAIKALGVYEIEREEQKKLAHHGIPHHLFRLQRNTQKIIQV